LLLAPGRSVEDARVAPKIYGAVGAPGRVAPLEQSVGAPAGGDAGNDADPDSGGDAEPEIDLGLADMGEVELRVKSGEEMKNATLEYWRNLEFLPTSPTLFDEDAITKAIAEMPVEVETDAIDPDDLDKMRSRVLAFIKAYSLKSFDDYVTLKGGREAFAAAQGSEYNAKRIAGIAAMLSQGGKYEEGAFDTVLGAFEEYWNVLYAESPYMDAVSFDVSFVAFKEADKDTFHPEKWTVDCSTNALTEYADTIGRMDRAVLYRAAENAIEPGELFDRHGTLTYCDVLVTTAQGEKQPFPVILRFYKDPDTGVWYNAFVAPFYGEGEDFRPLMP